MKIYPNIKKELKYGFPTLYYLLNNPNRLTKKDKIILERIKNRKSILLTGHEKSGNTWVRFVIFNYFNIKNNNAKDTMTFKELNTIQVHGINNGYTYPFKEGFPIFYRANSIYKKLFKYFDKTIYIHRNPMDTLISYYYFSKKRENPFHHFPVYRHDSLSNIDEFVKYTFPRWKKIHKSNMNKCDIILKYEDLKENPNRHFKKLFRKLDISYKPSILEKAIEVSDFYNVHKMEREHGYAGFNGKERKIKTMFTRKGTVGQYKKELQPMTIDYIMRCNK